MEDRLLRRREVEQITGMGHSSIYRLMQAGASPGPYGSALPPSGGGPTTSRVGWSLGR